MAHVLFWIGVGLGCLSFLADLFSHKSDRTIDGARVACMTYRVGFFLLAAVVAKYLGY